MQDFFEWDDERLSLKVMAMDNDHRRIVGLMNTLARQYEQGSPRAQLLDTANHLAKVAATHFASEEAYMERIGFPGLRAHKAIHDRLLTGVRAHIDALARDPQAIPREFLMFLKVWLTSHIRGVDRRYSEHAHQNVIGKSLA